jgi:hypothetical protein
VKEAYTEKNIIKAIISIIKEMASSDRLGFFIEDNAFENNTVIRVIIIHLCLNEKDFNFKRIRYLSYIINLAVKAFFLK